MTKKILTPDAVKKIETALEERKPKAERRQKSDAVPAGADRRKGKDRRTPD
jgi:hypothetical protein